MALGLALCGLAVLGLAVACHVLQRQLRRLEERHDQLLSQVAHLACREAERRGRELEAKAASSQVRRLDGVRVRT